MGFHSRFLRRVHHAVLGLDADCTAQAKDWYYIWYQLSVGVESVEEEWAGGGGNVMMLEWQGRVL